MPRARLLVLSLLALILLSYQTNSQTQTSSQSQPHQAATQNARAAHAPVNCTNNGTDVNSNGETVKRPENCSAPPKGTTAQCRDGSYSFSQTRKGTCSHHGGVAKWF
jgi:hypothetical protein